MAIEKRKMNSLFERYLSVWVGLCIIAGVGLGRLAPDLAKNLDSYSIEVNGAPVVSIPIAICLFLMMFPIMLKIDFHTVVRAGQNRKPVLLTLLINWLIKPFTMFALAYFFLGFVFKGLIGPEATDLVKLPVGLDLLPGQSHGAGKVVLHEGMPMLEIPLWRSYLAGAILLGIAPCTAMVLVWTYLAKANEGLTLLMVAINSLLMLLLYGLFGGFLLGVGRLPLPWEAILLSVGIYVALPLVSGYGVRRMILAIKGEEWFKDKFLPLLTPLTIGALLLTLVLLFSLKGDVISQNPMSIVYIAVPLFIQTLIIFALGYWLSRVFKLKFINAVPTAIIGASNHFEVAIASAVTLFGLGSGAALATVVGVLIEVPVMLLLVRVSLRTRAWFEGKKSF